MSFVTIYLVLIAKVFILVIEYVYYFVKCWMIGFWIS